MQLELWIAGRPCDITARKVAEQLASDQGHKLPSMTDKLAGKLQFQKDT